MGLIERVADRKRVAATRRGERTWPVGSGAVQPFESTWGHDDSSFSPPEYSDYLLGSNEIFSAAMLRARLMSSLRLGLFRGNDASKKAMPDHPASQLLNYVNDFWTARRLAMMDELSMCLQGESYWAVERDPGGKPSEIWWLKSSRMRPVPDETGYLNGYLYQPIVGATPIAFRPDEIIWFRYPNPLDEFSALSPLAAARLAADAASAMMKSNKNLFSNGLQLAGIIVPPADKVTFTKEQADDLADMLQKRFTGAEQRHRWAVLRYEAQFKEMTLSPKDAEFTAGLDLTLRQVANAYGIPVDLLASRGGNADGPTKTLWAHTLVPDSSMRAEEIAEQYLPLWTAKGVPDYAEYNYRAVPALQEYLSQTWDRDAQQLDRGAITINEWRQRNGLPDVDWGKAPWLPLNKAQFIDGKLQVPGQPVAIPPGGQPGSVNGDGTPVDPNAPPDDEKNPANQPPQVTGDTTGKQGPGGKRMFDHHAARRLIAEAFGDRPQMNGHAHTGW